MRTYPLCSLRTSFPFLPTHEFSFPPYLMEPLSSCSTMFFTARTGLTSGTLRAKFIEHTLVHESAIPVYTDGSKCATGVGFATKFPYKVISGMLPSASSLFTAKRQSKPYSLLLRTCFGFLELSLSSTQTLKVPCAPLAILFAITLLYQRSIGGCALSEIEERRCTFAGRQATLV